ncbi:MAG: M23 family metallopeptidase [Deltaproteobacteria bacterium]|nr:M23 family metallopeptidase [Deltaproteobacteria bacterium]
MRVRWMAALALCVAGSGGCATESILRPAMTDWGDAHTLPPALPSTQPAVIDIRDTDISAEPVTSSETARSAVARMGPDIDRALAHFVAVRTNNPAVKERILPPVYLQQWQALLIALSRALDWQPLPPDLGALIRGRVTLEVEMEHDRQRFPDIPHELTVGYVEALEKIDRRVRELKALTEGEIGNRRMSLPKGSLLLHWPLGQVVPSSAFGYRRDPVHGGLRFHSGIDLSAPPDTPVYAAAGGVVVFAAWSGGYGKYVVIEHSNGVRTHYAHLQHLFVETGTAVDQRSPVGTVGSTGRSTGPHLHFGVSVHGYYVDPTLYTGIPIAPDGSIPES